MADKKLNEVTKVTDMAYVPVIMSDGSIGQIAKADLASVVAGQMFKFASPLPVSNVGNGCVGLVVGRNYISTIFSFYIFWYSLGAKKVTMIPLGNTAAGAILASFSENVITFSSESLDEIFYVTFANR